MVPVNLSFSWADLARLTPGPGGGGSLRAEPHDFLVEELPAYPLSGSGDHLYLNIEKTGHTTAYVVRELARQLGVPDRQIGVAGLKDRHAVTTQWLSVPAKLEERLGGFALPGVRVLDTARHGNKLGIGHLRGNRFTVRVRGAPGSAGQAGATLGQLASRGVPNYFGPQRFGLGGLNAEEGLRVMRGESKLRDPRLTRFLVSSVQSLLFNRFVSERLARGMFERLLEGDMAKKHDTGGVFEVEDAEAESPRAARGEVSATGTLFGRKVKPLSGEAGDLERAVLDAFSLTPAAFASRKGDRRLTRVFVKDPSLVATPDGYQLSFELPRGSFATAVLRELVGDGVDAPESVPEDL